MDSIRAFLIVLFRATVVQQFDTFYMGVTSTAVKPASTTMGNNMNMMTTMANNMMTTMANNNNNNNYGGGSGTATAVSSSLGVVFCLVLLSLARPWLHGISI